MLIGKRGRVLLSVATPAGDGKVGVVQERTFGSWGEGVLWVVSDDAKRSVGEVTEEHEMVASIVLFVCFYLWFHADQDKKGRS